MSATRVLRAGRCVVATGAVALRAASRLSRDSSDPAGGARPFDRDAGARCQALCDVSREVLLLHGVEVECQDPAPVGPALLAANHVSWLDPLVVVSAVACVPVSKVDVSGWPVVGSLARSFGVLFVSRGSVRSGAQVLREAERALQCGMPVLNFPEGTTTRGDEVLPFHRGLFGLAARAGVPVVPVALSYTPADLAWTGQDRFVPHYLRLAAGGPARAHLRFGAPIASAELGVAELAERTRAAVRDLLRVK